jgi:hypothetical protein
MIANFLFGVVVALGFACADIRCDLPSIIKDTSKQYEIGVVEVASDDDYDRSGGFLSAYDENPTVGTIEYGQKNGMIPRDLSKYDGLVAVIDCWRVGHDAILTVGDEQFYVLVFDCAGKGDGGWDWMIRYSYLAEVDYYMRTKYPHIVGKYATITYRP